jgi:hypothetical protein
MNCSDRFALRLRSMQLLTDVAILNQPIVDLDLLEICTATILHYPACICWNVSASSLYLSALTTSRSRHRLSI